MNEYRVAQTLSQDPDTGNIPFRRGQLVIGRGFSKKTKRYQTKTTTIILRLIGQQDIVVKTGHDFPGNRQPYLDHHNRSYSTFHY
jgi:hypothetical protein